MNLWYMIEWEGEWCICGISKMGGDGDDEWELISPPNKSTNEDRKRDNLGRIRGIYNIIHKHSYPQFPRDIRSGMRMVELNGEFGGYCSMWMVEGIGFIIIYTTPIK